MERVGLLSSRKKKWHQRLLLFLAPFIFKMVVLPLFWSLPKRTIGGEQYRQLLDSGSPFIITFWHYAVVCAVVGSGGIPQIAMASASGDGDFIAGILDGMGVETVRGSRNRGGLGALKGLMKGVRRGLSPVLVADGSQGPAMVAQAGGILLASRTEIPIIPMAWAFKRYKIFGSWDRTMLPLPFSPMVEIIGEALHVPPKLDSQGIESYRQKLEEQLNGLYVEAWSQFDITDHTAGKRPI